jgi:hypothetical protein
VKRQNTSGMAISSERRFANSRLPYGHVKERRSEIVRTISKVLFGWDLSVQCVDIYAFAFPDGSDYEVQDE